MSKRKHKHRGQPPSGPVVVAVSWYTEQEWAKVRAAAADPEKFESTYPEWLAMVEATLAQMQARGVMVEKCFIESSSFLAWCLAHNRPNDSAARAAYVAEAGRASHERAV